MLCAFEGKCDNCGHDHGNPFSLPVPKIIFDVDNPVTMTNCELYKQANELIQVIESLGGSPKLTAVSTMAASLMRGIEEQEYKFRHICKEFQSLNSHTFMGEPVIRRKYTPYPRCRAPAILSRQKEPQ